MKRMKVVSLSRDDSRLLGEVAFHRVHSDVFIRAERDRHPIIEVDNL